jgi:hypothetical protein
MSSEMLRILVWFTDVSVRRIASFLRVLQIKDSVLDVFDRVVGGTDIPGLVLLGPGNGSIIYFETLSLFISCQGVTSNNKRTSKPKCSWKRIIKPDEVLLFWKSENVDYVTIEALKLSEHSVL